MRPVVHGAPSSRHAVLINPVASVDVRVAIRDGDAACYHRAVQPNVISIRGSSKYSDLNTVSMYPVK